MKRQNQHQKRFLERRSVMLYEDQFPACQRWGESRPAPVSGTAIIRLAIDEYLDRKATESEKS